MKKGSKGLCILINEAIEDEKKAPEMYKNLKDKLKKEESLSRAREYALDDIIKDEENHKRVFLLLAKQTGCKTE